MFCMTYIVRENFHYCTDNYIVICICIILVELFSTAASMLICFPNMPFLKLLKKALVGEIASKMNIKTEDVEKALEALNKK